MQLKGILQKLILINLVLMVISCGNHSKQTPNTDLDTASGDASLQRISREIEANPDDAELLYRRATLLFNQQNLKMAELDMDAALQRDSNNALYQFLLGRIEYGLNQTKAAAVAYEKSLHLKPDFIEARLKLANLYFIVKEHPKSIDLLKAGIKLDPTNAEMYHLLALNYRDMGDTSRAIYHFQTALENDPKDYESALYLANLYAAQNRELALDYYKLAVQLDPKSVDPYYCRAVFFQKRKAYRPALLDYRKVIAIDPENYLSYYNVGYINFETGFYDEAIRNWNICSRINSQYAPAYYMKGLVNELLHKKEDAIINYRFVTQLDPQDALANEALRRLKAK